MNRLAISCLGLLFAGCSVLNPTPTPSVATPPAPPDPSIQTLESPLALPTFSGRCQQSAAHPVMPGVADGLGPGPVWPVGLEPPGATLGASTDGVWHAVKVLWAAPSYTGPVLVRGGRIDAPGGMRFSVDGGATQTDQLDVPAGNALAYGLPSFTYVQAVGCYAYQIDGTGFSYEVVFEIG